MKNTPFLEFSVDKGNRKITVGREFAAPVERVWEAWTKPEILDKWWAPKPYKAVTVSMDFSVGGFWHYYMQGPEGDIHHSRADYKSIAPKQSFSWLDAFCDADGKVNTDLPRSLWDNAFEAKGDATVVHVVISYDKLEDLEKTLEMGFEEGFKMGLSNLDEYLDENK